MTKIIITADKELFHYVRGHVLENSGVIGVASGGGAGEGPFLPNWLWACRRLSPSHSSDTTTGNHPPKRKTRGEYHVQGGGKVCARGPPRSWWLRSIFILESPHFPSWGHVDSY